MICTVYVKTHVCVKGQIHELSRANPFYAGLPVDVSLSPSEDVTPSPERAPSLLHHPNFSYSGFSIQVQFWLLDLQHPPCSPVPWWAPQSPKDTSGKCLPPAQLCSLLWAPSRAGSLGGDVRIHSCQLELVPKRSHYCNAVGKELQEMI